MTQSRRRDKQKQNQAKMKAKYDDDQIHSNNTYRRKSSVAATR